MTALFENPMPIVIFGVIAVAVLGVVLLRTGRGAVLLAMIGVVALVLAGLGVEWLIVTDREAVENTLDGAAAAMEANPTGEARAEMLKHFIADSNAESRKLLDWAMSRVQFEKIKITDMETEINELTSPPSARVKLIGYATFKDRKGEFPYEGRPVSFTLKFRETEPGHWQVSGHEWHDDPR